jgi:hypothetical protein
LRREGSHARLTATTRRRQNAGQYRCRTPPGAESAAHTHRPGRPKSCLVGLSAAQTCSIVWRSAGRGVTPHCRNGKRLASNEQANPEQYGLNTRFRQIVVACLEDPEVPLHRRCRGTRRRPITDRTPAKIAAVPGRVGGADHDTGSRLDSSCADPARRSGATHVRGAGSRRDSSGPRSRLAGSLSPAPTRRCRTGGPRGRRPHPRGPP